MTDLLLDTWAAGMWKACWQSSLVVLAVWLICLAIPSMPARCRCWLWRLAILKFMVVLLLPTLVNLPLLPAPPVADPMPEVAVQVVRQKVSVRPVEQIEFHPTTKTSLPSIPAILAFLWIIGVGWSLARLLVAWRGAGKLRKQSRIIDKLPLIEELAHQARQYGLRNSPRVLETGGSGSPMLIGIVRPAIVIPGGTLRKLSPPELAMVLGHELAHIRRGDLLWDLVAAVVRAVFFYHPLVWLSQRRLNLAQEVAADELAILRQHGDPASYGKLLVSVVSKLGSSRLIPTMSMGTAGSVKSLTRRLVAMKRIGRSSRLVVVGSRALLAAVVMLGILSWRLVAAESKKIPEQGVLPASQPITPSIPGQNPTMPNGDAGAIAEIKRVGGRVVFDTRSSGKPVFGVSYTENVTDGQLEPLKQLTTLRSLSLVFGTKITDGGLVYLKALSNLEWLDLTYTGVTDEGLSHLKGLTKLTTLNLTYTKVGDNGLAYLEGLTNLQTLRLAHTKITDKGVKHLTRLPKLQSLEICGTQVTDNGLRLLAGLTSLQSLNLGGTQVTDAGLDHVKGLVNLQFLLLWQTKVTDAGLGQLSGLSRLQYLSLAFDDITDTGLGKLQSLSQIHNLVINDTRVTDAGVKNLQNKLPSCLITRSMPTAPVAIRNR